MQHLCSRYRSQSCRYLLSGSDPQIRCCLSDRRANCSRLADPSSKYAAIPARLADPVGECSHERACATTHQQGIVMHACSWETCPMMAALITRHVYGKDMLSLTIMHILLRFLDCSRRTQIIETPPKRILFCCCAKDVCLASTSRQLPLAFCVATPYNPTDT